LKKFCTHHMIFALASEQVYLLAYLSPPGNKYYTRKAEKDMLFFMLTFMLAMQSILF